MGQVKPWNQVWRLGESLVVNYVHGNTAQDDKATMWALLCHATRVSRAAYRGPPRSGYPAASMGAAMTAEDVSDWHKAAAYLRGELDKLEVGPSRPAAPSALEVTACDMVLELYHAHALKKIGDWKRMRAAIYMRACGAPPRAVVSATGVGRHRLRHAQDMAMADMLGAWDQAPQPLRNRAKSGKFHGKIG